MGSGYPEQELSYQALERLIAVLARACKGDFEARMIATRDGMEREVADALNQVLTTQGDVTRELARLADAVERGDLQVRAQLDKAPGGWSEQLRAVDGITSAFGRHAIELRRVIKAVQAGDLTARIPVSADGVPQTGALAQLAEETNAMVAQLESMTAELTRVLSELGIDGRLAARCHVGDAGGTWGQLVSGLNGMASALSEQVHDLCATTQLLAAGDLSARSWVNGRGDLQQLKTGSTARAKPWPACAKSCAASRARSRPKASSTSSCTTPTPAASGRARRMFAMQRSRSSATRCAASDKPWRACSRASTRSSSIPLRATSASPGSKSCGWRRREERTQKGLEILLHGRFHELKPGTSVRDSALFMLGIRLKHEWFGASRAGLVEARERHKDVRGFAQAALTCLTHTSGATVAAYYTVQDGDRLVQIASLGSETESGGASVRIGQGLVGRAALEQKPLLLDKLEGTGVRIRTGLLEIAPRAIVLFPIVEAGVTLAVVELVFVSEGATTAVELLEHLNPDLCAGARPTASRGSDAVRDSAEGSRALREELVIANARLESMSSDRQTREKHLRELEQVVKELREELERRGGAGNLAGTANGEVSGVPQPS